MCADADLIVLGGLALQAEMGDCVSGQHCSNAHNIYRKLTPAYTGFPQATVQPLAADYFTVSHYLPEGVYQRRRNVAQLLRDAHVGRRGMHAKDAEQSFVKHVQEMKEYGQHLYSAVWVSEHFCGHFWTN